MANYRTMHTFTLLAIFCTFSYALAQATDDVGNIQCIPPAADNPLCTLRVSGSAGHDFLGYWDLDMFDHNCVVIGHDSVTGYGGKYPVVLY